MAAATVPGYNDYMVSDDGRVFRKPGTMKCKHGREVRHWVESNGYKRVSLSSGGKVKKLYVHELVLMTFVGAKPAGYEARHLDGNRLNASLHNLAWGTRSENSLDKARHGTASKLGLGVVESIKLLRSIGIGSVETASIVGCCRNTVTNIVSGKTWRTSNVIQTA